jgi:hypothetical protein
MFQVQRRSSRGCRLPLGCLGDALPLHDAAEVPSLVAEPPRRGDATPHYDGHEISGVTAVACPSGSTAIGVHSNDALRIVTKRKYGAVRRTLGLSKKSWLIPEIAILVDSFLQLDVVHARRALLSAIYAAADSDSDIYASMPALADAVPSDTDSSMRHSGDDDDTMSHGTFAQHDDDLYSFGIEQPARSTSYKGQGSIHIQGMCSALTPADAASLATDSSMRSSDNEDDIALHGSHA